MAGSAGLFKLAEFCGREEGRASLEGISRLKLGYSWLAGWLDSQEGKIELRTADIFHTIVLRNLCFAYCDEELKMEQHMKYYYFFTDIKITLKYFIFKNF